MQDDKKLRIGYLSPGWPLADHPNGVVAYVENMIDGLENDIKPIILASRMHEKEQEGFTVNLAKYNSDYANVYFKVLAKLSSILKSENDELIQYKKFLRASGYVIKCAMKSLRDPLDLIEMEESFGLNYYSINKTKTRFVTRLHGPWFIMTKMHNIEPVNESKLRIFYEGEAIKRSHGVTAPSLDVLEKVREYYNLELADAKVIPNPIQLVSEDKQWRLTKGGSYILFVGRFDSTKGGDLIIDSFNIIAQADKSVVLYIVGPDTGIVVDGKKLAINQYILKNILNESIRERIKFFGHCDHEKISTLRQEARVTVCCSRYETFGLSLLEALATGCPTVATAVGGIKEIIIDDYNGLFAEPESPESIAEKVLSLMNNSEKLALLSKNAIKDTIKRFSTKDIAKQSVDYYRLILSRYG